eukprot:NODE_32008_length_385_cov_0.957364.p3 GENE.NODE_32008_length_385_cov_0.957364~~NODE_32008_length_385_cov_0.957364.p3  ORF type:complete len:67 (-),score=0.58 NODE_32008_length_385_cov_0.957364:21-221(-)
MTEKQITHMQQYIINVVHGIINVALRGAIMHTCTTNGMHTETHLSNATKLSIMPARTGEKQQKRDH